MLNEMFENGPEEIEREMMWLQELLGQHSGSGHLLRMKLTMPVAGVYNLNTETPRGRGRARRRWTEWVNDNLRLYNISSADLQTLSILARYVVDRKTFR